jgi:hypothetical protein
MKEPSPADYLLTKKGADEFARDMEIWQNAQKNARLKEARAAASELLAQNDAAPEGAALPGSRVAATSNPLIDAGYAAMGTGAKVFGATEGLLGTLAETAQQAVKSPVVPDVISSPAAKFFDASAEGARLARDRAQQFAAGVDRYLQARRLLREEGGFDAPSAIAAGGEVARQLVGGPAVQALMAYGERDNPVDAAKDLLASKVAKALPLQNSVWRGAPVPLASAEAKRRAVDLLAEKLLSSE